MTIQQAFEVAHGHHQSGRLADAEAIYRQILAVEPRHAVALHYLGVIAHQMGRNEVAAHLIRQAIAIKPGDFEARSNLGTVMLTLGQLDEAIATYRQAIAINPSYAEAHYNLGVALKSQGLVDDAIASFRQAIAFNPSHAEAHNNLGDALIGKGLLDECIVRFRQAIAINPSHAEAHYNLGNALYQKGQLNETILACRRSIALRPDFTEPHWTLALALLLQGDFLRGLEEYEWRCKLKDAASQQRDFAQPRWDGGPLEGRTVLLYAEQGFGDTLQFIRYLPLVQGRGGNIIIECHPELRRLLQDMAPGLRVVAKGHELPAFDVHFPLLSLPRLFATDLDNIPRNVPYLRAHTAAAKTWRDRLVGQSASLKVGLVWAGNPAFRYDRLRSPCDLSLFSPLGNTGGVHFYSLQKGEAAKQGRMPPTGMTLHDWTDDMRDFADTAALMENLDLIVSSDTAVAHLAGAMGKPVWTLLPFVPDWRWFLDRGDSPWYPTMRLFRQPAIGDWASVIAQVREQLQLLVRTHGLPSFSG